MGVFMKKLLVKKIELKKSPKIMFTLAAMFVAIEYATLIVRIVYDALHINARLRAEAGELLSETFFVTLNVIGALSVLLMFSDYIFLFVVLFFFQRIL